MEESGNFENSLFTIAEKRIEWFDSVELPKLLNEYRIIQSLIASLFSILLKKGILVEDPYKLEKKRSDIVVPPDTAYSENDKNLVIGTRLSDFEVTLDFLCNYFKFSVETLTLERIKSLALLNNCFLWQNMTANSPKANTRGLASILMLVRQGTDTLSIGIINDNINHLAKTTTKCNAILKKLTEFQKELYKIEIRHAVLQYPQFDIKKCEENPAHAMPQIKKFFPNALGKKQFYTELIEEVIQESFGSDSLALQQALLEKLEIPKKQEGKKEQEIEPKTILMEAIRTIGSITPQFEELITKIEENRKILQNQDTSLLTKLRLALRKAFNIEEKSIVYMMSIVDQLTQIKKQIPLNYVDFLTDLNKRSRLYSSFSLKKAQGYAKMESLEEKQILEFLTKQIAECQQMLTLLTALDDYFKVNANVESRSKIKGIRIEIAAVKNSLVKANQRRVEYTSYKEEQAQLRKMGIISD